MRKETVRLVLAVGLAAASVTGCGKLKSSEKEQTPAAAVRPVCTLSPEACSEIGLETEPVFRKPFFKTVTIPAQVLANQDNEAQVGSLVQGRVCRIFAKVGDYVKAGQELMREEGLEIGEIKAKYLSARAQLTYQQKNFERQKRLLEENVGSQKAFLESQSEYEKALAEFGAEKNRIAAIGLSDREIEDAKAGPGADRCQGSASLSIKSPISGIVIERNVVVGQLIDGSTNAFRIINLNSVWVDGQIYEKDMDKAVPGASVQFHASAFPDTSFTGKIIYVGQVIDEKTRAITVRAEFPNPEGRLKPHLFGSMQMPAGRKSAAITIPAEALVKMDTADYVFVKKEKFSFEKRRIKAGTAQKDVVEIEEGLKEGDTIVVKGAFYLKAELLKGGVGEGE